MSAGGDSVTTSEPVQDSCATDATAVDWEHLFDVVAGGVTEPLPPSTRRAVLIQAELDLPSEDDAHKLVEDARKRGLIVSTEVRGTEGLYFSDAIENPAEYEPEPEPEPTDVDGEGSHDEPKPDPADMPRGDLEQEVRELRKGMKVMETRVDSLVTRMDTLTQAVFGQTSVPGDPDKSEDLLTKFVGMRDRVDEHDDKLTIVSSESGSRNTPDERAQSLRMTLYEEASTNNGKAAMDRDQAKYALNGGLNRSQLLDAMRRAADGSEANINGSSDLEPLDGVEFVKGSGRSNQSKIRMNLTEMTGEDLRMIRTTEDTDKGGN